MKKKGYNGHTGLWREKPCKNLGGKWQKIAVEPCRVGERERGKFENFWKRCFEQIKIWLSKKLIQDFWLIENQFWLIETDKSSQTILKEISINRRTDWINRKSGKTTF